MFIMLLIKLGVHHTVTRATGMSKNEVINTGLLYSGSLISGK